MGNLQVEQAQNFARMMQDPTTSAAIWQELGLGGQGQSGQPQSGAPQGGALGGSAPSGGSGQLIDFSQFGNIGAQNLESIATLGKNVAETQQMRAKTGLDKAQTFIQQLAWAVPRPRLAVTDNQNADDVSRWHQRGHRVEV